MRARTRVLYRVIRRFQDILRADGTRYHLEEVQLIRKINGAKAVEGFERELAVYSEGRCG